MTLELEEKLAVVPLSPAIGALVVGIDLSWQLSSVALRAIEAALVEHQVLFFENQNLSPSRQRDLARGFGELHVHPIYPNTGDLPEIMILDTHAANPPDNDNWHTDVTFVEKPPMGTLLYARQIPAVGGDTMWSNMIAAYDALSSSYRGFLDGLTATHDFEKSFPRVRKSDDPAYEEKWLHTRRTHPPVSHPVVRTHPVSKKKGLFVNFGFTTRINELNEAESRTVLQHLFEHVTRPEFTVRYRWKEGTLAFWDNRCTQHYALADYLPNRRVMNRATVIGEKPV